MNTLNSSSEIQNPTSRTSRRNRGLLRFVQLLSWAVTALFLVSLIGAIYQGLINGNPLPMWAWLGMAVLFAVGVGLVVMVIVYRGVSSQTGPFDMRTSTRVTGELQHETRRVEAGGASALRAEIRMVQGDLQLTGGAAEAIEADFTYDDADWQPPVVAYEVDAAGQGNLAVHQKATGRPTMRQGRCEWVVRLNEALPTDLRVQFGAGKAVLRLGGMSLTRLHVESGVGEVVVDLSGEWERSLAAFIKTGIGDTVLRLPENAGVRVESTVGFGRVKPHGLTYDGEAYTNALYGQSAVNLDITVEGGMGKLSLEPAG